MEPVAGPGSRPGARDLSSDTRSAHPDLRAVMAASPHGTEARYGAGCRCEACRGAHAERMRRYRARRRGQVPLPPERWEGSQGAPEEIWTPEPRGALGGLGALALGTLVLAIAARRHRRPSPEPRPGPPRGEGSSQAAQAIGQALGVARGGEPG